MENLTARVRLQCRLSARYFQLSRSFITTAKGCQTRDRRSNMETCADRYVHHIARIQTPRAMHLEEIRKAKLEDPELQKVKQCLQNNKLHQLPRSYRLISHELCITGEELLLRSDRIVLPCKLRHQVIILAHKHHAGMVTCKQCLRSKLW